MCVLVAAVGSGQAAGVGTNAVPGGEGLAITHGLFMQAPSERGMTVSWATSRNHAASHRMTGIASDQGARRQMRNGE